MEAGQLGTRTTGSAHFVGINFIPVNTQTLLMDWLASVRMAKLQFTKITLFLVISLL
jgi:hypothetical protein